MIKNSKNIRFFLNNSILYNNVFFFLGADASTSQLGETSMHLFGVNDMLVQH